MDVCSNSKAKPNQGSITSRVITKTLKKETAACPTLCSALMDGCKVGLLVQMRFVNISAILSTVSLSDSVATLH